MLRVTVVGADGSAHEFAVTGAHEDYAVAENPLTGELVVERVSYARRGEDLWARTGAATVAAWPAGLWRTASLHSLAPHAQETFDAPYDDGEPSI